MSDLPYPNLLHPIPVWVRLRNQDGTKYDSDTNEPIGKVARNDPIKLVCQVSRRMFKLIMGKEGKEFKAEGYLLFLRRDLKDKSIDINEGDQITQIGEGDFARSNLNLYFNNIVDVGHNDNFFGSTMIKAWFNDKKPVRHS
jgi:hypothetical protein